MMKRLCSILLISIMLVASGISVFGYHAKTVVTSDTIDDEVIYDASTKPTDQFLVKITRPAAEECILKKSLGICGVTNEDKPGDIGVMLLMYDIKKDEYVDFVNTDRQSNWGLGKFGIFIKEIKFPVDEKEIEKYKNKNDEYKIRLVAFKKSEVDSLKLNDNLQVSDFTITVLDEGFSDKLINGINKLKSIVEKMLK